MIAALLLLLPAFAGDFEVGPRELAWEELSPARFDLRWRLPDARRAAGRDLLAEMERLAALELELEEGAGRGFRSLGDLAPAARRAPDRQRWLRRLLTSDPELARAWGPQLRELLLDGTLRKADWDPDDDSPFDGILLGGSWSLAEEGEPWSSLAVEPIAQQAVVLIRADLATIKAAENDYRRYPDIPGASYEEIYPVARSYVRGRDPRGKDYAALALYFRSELPLWYPDYRCDLRLLNRVDAAGRLVCDIYSSSDDFHWLAGRDVYLPLESSGESGRAAYLVVRQYGFDIDGVPDGAKHVRAALRQSLGSLKLAAEARAGRDGSARADRGPARVPAFRVLGRR